MKRPTLTQAKALYPYRYTLEHKPQWASKPAPNGKLYAPQYASDAEWYANTVFPPHEMGYGSDCYSTGASRPTGEWL